jgi:hypothetical protein
MEPHRVIMLRIFEGKTENYAAAAKTLISWVMQKLNTKFAWRLCVPIF